MCSATTGVSATMFFFMFHHVNFNLRCSSVRCHVLMQHAAARLQPHVALRAHVPRSPRLLLTPISYRLLHSMLFGWSHLAIQTSNEIPFVTFGTGEEATDVFVACHTGSACVVAPVAHKYE